jgi:hypothetical protein
MSEKAKIVLDLRKRFPKMEFRQFMEIIEIFWTDGISAVVEMLTEEELKASAREAEEQRKVEEVLAQIKASELHHKLRIEVPEHVDLEHTQAILTYGFIAPSSKRSFMGSNKVSVPHVRTNVENKLLGRFNLEQYETAWHWLTSLGVIEFAYSRTKKGACSLVTNVPKSRVKDETKRLIEAVHRFNKAWES